MNHIIEALQLIWHIITAMWYIFMLIIMTIFFFTTCGLALLFQGLALVCVYLAEVYCRTYEVVQYKLKNK